MKMVAPVKEYPFKMRCSYCWHTLFFSFLENDMEKIVILSSHADIDKKCVQLLNWLFEDCEISVVPTASEITNDESGYNLSPKPVCSRCGSLSI